MAHTGIATRSTKYVADICLYGTSETGAGFIARTLKKRSRTYGNGEPRSTRTFTEAIWLAVEGLKDLGVRKGLVRIFEPSGERMSVVDIAKPVPSYGMLTWEPAVQYVIEVKP